MREVVLMLEMYAERYISCTKAQKLSDLTFAEEKKENQFYAIVSYAKMKMREEQDNE